MNTENFNYKKYLASREWAILKQELLKRSLGFCERCAVGKYEETHHLTYERIGHERLEDLQAVCSACHRFVSAKSEYDPAGDIVIYAIAFSRKSAPGLLWRLASIGCRILGRATQIEFSSTFIAELPVWTQPDHIGGPQSLDTETEGSAISA